MAESPFDAIFMTAAQRAGGIQPLLDEFFSFLHRRTDFYVVDPNPRRPMGFPEGAAEAMVLKTLRALPFKHVPASAAPVAKEPKPSQPPRLPAEAAPPARLTPVAPPAEARAAAPAPSPAPQVSIRHTEEGKQIPIGNGGVGPNYWWTQTLTEATVYLDVTAGTASKEVVWEVTPSTVRLALKRGGVLLEGELGGSVRAAESMWALEDGRTLVLTFEKAVHTWWACVVKGHPEVDTTKVDSTMKVEEYDEETQAALRKIMFDQAQKAKGLPTSEDMLMAAAGVPPGAPYGGVPLPYGGVPLPK